MRARTKQLLQTSSNLVFSLSSSSFPVEAAGEPLLSRQEVQHRGARQAQRRPNTEQLQPVRGRAQAGRGQSEGRPR